MRLGTSPHVDFLGHWYHNGLNWLAERAQSGRLTAYYAGTTGVTPMSLLANERAVMLPAPALKAPPRLCHRVVMPMESLQHPLSVYDELLRVVA